jgi:hypothetical protein
VISCLEAKTSGVLVMTPPYLGPKPYSVHTVHALDYLPEICAMAYFFRTVQTWYNIACPDLNPMGIEKAVQRHAGMQGAINGITLK